MPKSAHSFEKKYISHICHQDIYSKQNFKLPVNPHGLVTFEVSLRVHNVSELLQFRKLALS